MKRVCIIGGFNMELVLPGLTCLPRWGRQTIVEDHRLRKVGASTNIAFPLTKLGVPCSLIGSVGDDLYGREIVEQIKSYGLEEGGIDVVKGSRTGICAALVRDNGEQLIVSSLGSMNSFNESNVNRHWDLIDGADYLFLAGYFVAPGIGFGGARNILSRAKEEGKTTFLDTGWDSKGWPQRTKGEVYALLRYVDVFLPNLEEASALTKAEKPEEMAEKLRSYGCGRIVIKMGDRGSLALDEDGFSSKEVFSVDVLDTTGSGDAFDAGVIYGLIKGWAMDRTLEFSNALSAIVISNLEEDRYPTLGRVEDFVSSQRWDL